MNPPLGDMILENIHDGDFLWFIFRVYFKLHYWWVWNEVGRVNFHFQQVLVELWQALRHVGLVLIFIQGARQNLDSRLAFANSLKIRQQALNRFVRCQLATQLAGLTRVTGGTLVLGLNVIYQTPQGLGQRQLLKKVFWRWNLGQWDLSRCLAWR